MKYTDRINKKYISARRDLSHLPVEKRLIEVTKGVFNWVNAKLADAQLALKPKRQIKKSEITPEVQKILDDIEAVSKKANEDIEKIRKDINDFIYKKYAKHLDIPF